MKIVQAEPDVAREIGNIFAEAAAGADAYPGPLGAAIRGLVKRAEPTDRDRKSNYIAFMLPSWIGERTGADPALCRDLAVGNVYAMLHFFLLDDVMDGGDAGMEGRRALAVGQLLQALFTERYARRFPPDSPLWAYYRTYLAEWGNAVSEEGLRRADPRDPRALARKSAPVKLGATAILLSAGLPEQIRDTEEAVELALASLQLADDWADWREDLNEERCNAFLTLVRRESLALPEDQPLQERLVLQAIYRKGALETLASIVLGYGERLASLPRIPQGLPRFQQEILSGILHDVQATRDATDKLASGGGFSYFLSKMKEL
ncbi:hypothetical protein [Cohnella sp. JJ-181]|uniref:hypothetical protein n=1 Tax=Cohnella rhizoplanae TaxID=2974897 RepID=UPI0022FF9487|nr:hypothetical protein [Cohnella sp. JJ-181]CAI6086622.1 hypothetical protein COHCIP112018_05098 [Cohnella sp. JJ-181]